MNIDLFRRRVVAGSYELTQHAIDEAANDDMDIEDIETVILTGKVARTLTQDTRGTRFVIHGVTRSKLEADVVCRILSSGKMRIITVYLKR